MQRNLYIRIKGREILRLNLAVIGASLALITAILCVIALAGCQSAAAVKGRTVSALASVDAEFDKVDGTATALENGAITPADAADDLHASATTGKDASAKAAKGAAELSAAATKWEEAYHSRPALIALGGAVLGGLVTIVGLGGWLGLAASIPILSFVAGKVGARVAAWGFLALITCSAIYECWPYRWYIMGGAAALALALVLFEHFVRVHLLKEIDRVEDEIVNNPVMGLAGSINYKDSETIKYARIRMSDAAFRLWCQINRIGQ